MKKGPSDISTSVSLDPSSIHVGGLSHDNTNLLVPINLPTEIPVQQYQTTAQF